MTFERKIVVGLDELRAVTFECVNPTCKARTTIHVDGLRSIPDGCNACNAIWNPKILNDYVQTSGPAEAALINSIVRVRTLIQEKRCPVRILLEFNEPDGK
jgi:hypothetical protein